MRRPETDDPSQFWYCSPANWDQMQASVMAVLTTPKQKAAMNSLRKFEHAGLIMETDDGKAAPSPCHWCTREGAKVDCRVFAGRDDRACAYCKRMSKGGCAAAVEEALTTEERTTEERATEERTERTIEALQGQVDAQKEQLLSCEAHIKELENEVVLLKEQMAQVLGNTNTVIYGLA